MRLEDLCHYVFADSEGAGNKHEGGTRSNGNRQLPADFNEKQSGDRWRNAEICVTPVRRRESVPSEETLFGGSARRLQSADRRVLAAVLVVLRKQL
ncbi:unnamed protein product [Bursaphelenchus okinawaensis]|uniref:Uncharacterized protein n=1 Tax=Bursaphelenchus okinawaensis TaxID=465554 RepID=A0A811LQ78_9BILA|nr:unnamed protein product [Bursaphelenchus okinawaensis]CAG9126068.1 unnamed protein product [Bursaphelenchus okinawaensis]